MNETLRLYELIKREFCYECQNDCDNCEVGKVRELVAQLLNEHIFKKDAR